MNESELLVRGIVPGGEGSERPPFYKAIGIGLAIGSGLFIGTSFVLKKVGLLKANEKYNEVAGEGYGYLKNAFWWGGMTLMIVGEICNFVAYAFTDAILVTPLGALSVVITTVLSAIFLKERLSMVGKVACFLCIVGSVVIVMNAPTESSVADIQQMQHFFISPGFLSYAGVILVGSAIVAFYVGPRWGKKNMLVYISICSWIGGLSVVSTQGLGAAIIAWIGGKPQYKEWFLWVLFVFVICTLVTEIIFLNVRLDHKITPLFSACTDILIRSYRNRKHSTFSMPHLLRLHTMFTSRVQRLSHHPSCFGDSRDHQSRLRQSSWAFSLFAQEWFCCNCRNRPRMFPTLLCSTVTWIRFKHLLSKNSQRLSQKRTPSVARRHSSGVYRTLE